MVWTMLGAASRTAFNSSPRNTPDPNACVNCKVAELTSSWEAPAMMNCLFKFSAKAMVSSLFAKASLARCPNDATVPIISK